MDQNRLQELNQKYNSYGPNSYSNNSDFVYKIEDKPQEVISTNKSGGLGSVVEDSMEVISKTSAYKKYFSTRAEVLQEVKTISKKLGIPEEAISSSAENLDKARAIYSDYEKQLDMKTLYERYPGLEKLAKLDSTSAAIALHNLDNVKETSGIIEAAKTGWDVDSLQKERSDIGQRAMLYDLTDADKKRLNEIENEMANMKELPDFFDHPLEAVVGGVAQQAPMMARQALKGQKEALAGAVLGGIVGGAAAGLTTAGTGTFAGIAHGARVGYSVGSRLGFAKAMFEESAGNYYLDYLKNVNGKDFSEKDAVIYATVSAMVETGIEFANADKVIKILKGKPGTAGAGKIIEGIVKKSKDTASLKAQLKTYIKDNFKNVATVAVTESAEEGVQQAATMGIQNIAASNHPNSGIQSYSASEILEGSVQAAYQALPASIGLGGMAAAGSGVRFVRQAAGALELSEKGLSDRVKNIRGIQMIEELMRNKETSKFAAEHPDTYHKLMENNLEESGYEKTYVDTELLLQQENGMQILNQLASEMNMDAEQLQNIIDTKANLEVPTADYMTVASDPEARSTLNNYISFDAAADCFARNKKIAEEMQENMDKMVSADVERTLQNIHNIAAANFEEGADRDMAEFIIGQYENPTAGLQEYRAERQAEIDAMLQPVIDIMKDGMKKGVAIYRDEDTGRYLRASNNDMWYSKFYKENGAAPTKQQLRDIAYDIIANGKNEYGVPGYDMRDREAMEWAAGNKAQIESLQSEIDSLNRIEEKLKTIDTADFAAMEGLSQSGVKVYKAVAERLRQAPSAAARKSAGMGALVFAHRAEIYADAMRKAGYKDYTAEDYMKKIQIRFNNARGGSLFNQAVGRRSMTQDYKKLMQAMDMYEKNRSGEEIYKETGWWRGDDGKWRYEVPDKLENIDLSKIREYTSMPLGEIYDNKELYDAYPFLREVNIVYNPELKEDYNGVTEHEDGTYIIMLNPAASEHDQKTTLVHEIQHYIQWKEGFASGGSPETVRKQVEERISELKKENAAADDKVKEWYKLEKKADDAFRNDQPYEELYEESERYAAENNISEEAQEKYAQNEREIQRLQNALDSKNANDLYEALHGEQEARITAERAEGLRLYTYPGGMINNSIIIYAPEETSYSETKPNKENFYAVNLSGNEFEYKNLKDLREKAVKWYKDNLQGQKAYNPFLGEILLGKGFEKDYGARFTGKGLSKMSSTSANPNKLLSIKYLKEIIENANFCTESDPTKIKHAREYFYYIHAKVIIKEKDQKTEELRSALRYVIVTIKQNQGKDLIYYNHNLFTESEYKKIEDAYMATDTNDSSAGQEANVTSSFINSITGKGKIFKQQSVTYNQTAGARAVTANLEALQQAQEMYMDWVDEKEIFEKTGWYRGADEKWRYEIPDNLNLMYVEKIQPGKTLLLKEVYQNEQLYKAYPELAEIKVTGAEGTNYHGQYYPEDNTVSIAVDHKPDTIKKALVHEIQHYIQWKEGFASGGDPENVRKQMREQIKANKEEAASVKNGAEYYQAYKDNDQERMAALSESMEYEDINKIEQLVRHSEELREALQNNDEYTLYYGLAGEVEARRTADNAQAYTDNDMTAVTNSILDNNYGYVVFGNEIMGAYSMKNSSIRGQSAIGDRGERIIYLYESADESTFIHEMAHMFFADLRELAELENVPAQIKRDYNTLTGWANWQDGQLEEYRDTAVYAEFATRDVEIKMAQEKGYVERRTADGVQQISLEALLNEWRQERFARGFEEYMRRGQAPTEGLKGVFRRFKTWLTKIYRSCKAIAAEPSEEVKAVMDRLLASEDAIDSAIQKANYEKFREAGGLKYLEGTGEQMWQRIYDKIHDDAAAKVLKVAMQDLTEQAKEERQQRIEQERAAAEERISQEPVFIVWQYLKNNPKLDIEETALTIGNMTADEFAAELKKRGGSLKAAVDQYMKEYTTELDQESQNPEVLRAAAEEAVQNSYYKRLLTAYEAEALEEAIKKEQKTGKRLQQIKDGTEQERVAAEEALKKLNAKDRKYEQLKREREESLKGRRALRDLAVGKVVQITQYAEERLATMGIREAANPAMWAKMARQKSDEANAAIVKNDWATALKAKKEQLVYDVMAEKATKNKTAVEKSVKRISDRINTMRREKNVAANDRYLYQHLLYVFGIAKRDAVMPPTYQGFLQTLVTYDETLSLNYIDEDGHITLPEWLLNAATSATPRKGGYIDLTMDEFGLLRDMVDNIYKAGVEAKQMKTVKDTEGHAVTIDEAAAAIAEATMKNVRERQNNDPTGAGNIGVIDRIADTVDAAHVALIKAETICRIIGEPAMQYIYNPLSKTADNEMKMAKELQKHIHDIFALYKERKQELNADKGGSAAKKIAEKALSDFYTKKEFRLGTSLLTRENMIAIALNWGTDINRKRVMDGFNVSASQVEILLENLDGADWELVVEMWKTFDRYWEDLQRVEANVSGTALEKQPPVEFSILGKDGVMHTLPGGYYPLKYDRKKNIDVGAMANDEAQKMQMGAQVRFSLGLGNTKQRTQGNVNYKIRTDINVFAESLSDTIHNIAMRETIRDINRLVRNDIFKESILSHFGGNTLKMLQNWVLDCWQQEPQQKNGYEKAMQILRQNQTAAVLGYRVITAAINAANIGPMMDYIGAVNSVSAIKNYYAHPIEQYDLIINKSIFMRERVETLDRDMRDVASKISKKISRKNLYDKVQENAFDLLTKTDLMLACPLWLNEYQRVYQESMEKKLSAEQAEGAAIAAGDAAVRRVFGSGRTMDLAEVQRGNETMKSLTTFYSYFSVVHNALALKLYESRKAKMDGKAWFKAMAPIISGILFWMLIPAVIETAIRAGMSGDDDDKDPEALMKKTLSTTIGTAVGGIPILRDAVPMMLDQAMGERAYTPKTYLISFYDQIRRVGTAITSENKTAVDVASEMLKLSSNFTGMSQSLLNAFMSVIKWFEYGQLSQEDVQHYMWSIIMGKDPLKK